MTKLADFRRTPLSEDEERENIPVEDRLDKPARFIANPWYDKVFLVRLDQPLPPKQTKAKTQNRFFEKSMFDELERLEMTPEMPFTGSLLVVLSIAGPKEYIKHADIDNMCKALLDCMKGRVFVDDRQVHQLAAHKYVRDVSYWSAGVRRISDNAKDGLNIPPFFGRHPEDRDSA